MLLMLDLWCQLSFYRLVFREDLVEQLVHDATDGDWCLLLNVFCGGCNGAVDHGKSKTSCMHVVEIRTCHSLIDFVFPDLRSTS